MTSITRLRAATLATVVVAAFSSPLAAQSASGPTYGVIGNVAIPFSDLGNVSGLGLGGGAFVEGKPTGFPVGLRADGVYNRFTGKDGFDGFNLLQFTGNAIFNFPSSGKKGASPVYAIGGLGFYRFSGGGSSSTEVGFNLGGGYNLKAAKNKPFIEARLHFVDESEWLSLGFGVRF